MSLNDIDNLLNPDGDIDMLIRPFAFIYKCCKDIKSLDYLRSNENDPNKLANILAIQKLKTTQIMARLKKDNSFWGKGDEDMNNNEENELVEKKKFIKKRLEKLMNNNNELIYTAVYKNGKRKDFTSKELFKLTPSLQINYLEKIAQFPEES